MEGWSDGRAAQAVQLQPLRSRNPPMSGAWRERRNVLTTFYGSRNPCLFRVGRMSIGPSTVCRSETPSSLFAGYKPARSTRSGFLLQSGPGAARLNLEFNPAKEQPLARVNATACMPVWHGSHPLSSRFGSARPRRFCACPCRVPGIVQHASP